jgi:type I restriction enzyme, R subunit
MNKKELTEADIRTKFITPALVGPNGSKWNMMTQLREEMYFTKGRVIVRGKTVKRGEAKKADYILYFKPGLPIAVVEAKDNTYTVGAGMQQALEYAEILDLPFAYSSNGIRFRARNELQSPHRESITYPSDLYPVSRFAAIRASTGTALST